MSKNVGVVDKKAMKATVSSSTEFVNKLTVCGLVMCVFKFFNGERLVMVYWEIILRNVIIVRCVFFIFFMCLFGVSSLVGSNGNAFNTSDSFDFMKSRVCVVLRMFIVMIWNLMSCWKFIL